MSSGLAAPVNLLSNVLMYSGETTHDLQLYSALCVALCDCRLEIPFSIRDEADPNTPLVSYDGTNLGGKDLRCIAVLVDVLGVNHLITGHYDLLENETLARHPADRVRVLRWNQDPEPENTRIPDMMGIMSVFTALSSLASCRASGHGALQSMSGHHLLRWNDGKVSGLDPWVSILKAMAEGYEAGLKAQDDKKKHRPPSAVPRGQLTSDAVVPSDRAVEQKTRHDA